jgi:hypothetical protein
MLSYINILVIYFLLRLESLVGSPRSGLLCWTNHINVGPPVLLKIRYTCISKHERLPEAIKILLYFVGYLIIPNSS